MSLIIYLSLCHHKWLKLIMANGFIVSMTLIVCSLVLYEFQSLIDENAEIGHSKHSTGWVCWGEYQPQKIQFGLLEVEKECLFVIGFTKPNITMAAVNTTALCLTLINNILKKPHCLGMWICSKTVFQHFLNLNNFPQVTQRTFSKKMHTLTVTNESIFKKGFTLMLKNQT